MSWDSTAWFLHSLFTARIAVQNPNILDRFLNCWPPKGKARLYSPGVDSQKFHPGLPNRLVIRRQLGISAEAPLIACTADLIDLQHKALQFWEERLCMDGFFNHFAEHVKGASGSS